VEPGRLALPPAGWWRSWLAGAVDTALGLVLFALSAMWLALGLWALRGFPRTPEGTLILTGGLLGLAVGLHLVYHLVWVGGCGQTPGRILAGIALLRRDGRRPGYGRAALRVLGGVLVWASLGLLALPFICSRRGLPDRLAGTWPGRVRG
jgi:uncharacterized RDD family membrane protein YckC